jgi:hypothetical protein
MTRYNKLKMEEELNNLKLSEIEILRVAAEDDTSHTLMFALNNLKAAIIDLEKSINTTRVEFSEPPEHLEIIKKTLGL